MGNGLLILVFGAVLGATVLSFQQKQTALETTERQAEYEEEVLAREIARSAYNIAKKLVQAAGDVIHIGWQYQSLQELIDVFVKR